MATSGEILLKFDEAFTTFSAKVEPAHVDALAGGLGPEEAAAFQVPLFAGVDDEEPEARCLAAAAGRASARPATAKKESEDSFEVLRLIYTSCCFLFCSAR